MNPGILESPRQFATLPRGLLGLPYPMPMPGQAGLHHEALGWAARARANGGIVSDRTMQAVSQFMYSIDSAGLRNRFGRLNLFVGGNLAACLTPQYITFGPGSPVVGNATDTNNNFVSGDYNETGARSGLTGNGTSKSLNTGYPANTVAAASTHLGVGLRTTDNNAVSFPSLLGAYNGTTNIMGLHARWNIAGQLASSFTRWATTSDLFGDDIGSSGAALAVGDIVAAWPTMYRNGVASGAIATTSQDYPTNHPIWVFSLSTGSGYTLSRINWYSFGRTMTAAQALAFSSAIAAFNSTLSRS